MQRSKSFIASKTNTKEARLSESFICSIGDSMKSISDCPTMVSELSLMEDIYHDETYQCLENSLKTETPKSSYIHPNPNAKKNKILLVESRLIETKDIAQSDQIENEMNALLQIQKKTQRLVIKQRQQRKQLTKLKKLYLQKEEEISRYQERLKTETNTLRKQIDQIKNDKLKLTEQKQRIEMFMNELQLHRKQTYIQISKYKRQREELINQIELYDINFKNASPITYLQQKSIKDVDRQIDIINSLIKKKRTQNSNHVQIEQLLQIKIQYLEQRQSLKVKIQTKKHEAVIKQLNQSIYRRNCLIKHKNSTIQKLLESDRYIYQKEKEGFCETSDTFLQSSYQYQQEKLIQNQHLSDELKDIVKSHCITGHQQSFEAVKTILLGINNLQQSCSIPHQDLINLVDITLQNLASKLVSKAKQKLNKIQDMCDIDKISLNK